MPSSTLERTKDFGLRRSERVFRSSLSMPRSPTLPERSLRALATMVRRSRTNDAPCRAISGSRSGPKTSRATTSSTNTSPIPMSNTAGPHVRYVRVRASVLARLRAASTYCRAQGQGERELLALALDDHVDLFAGLVGTQPDDQLGRGADLFALDLDDAVAGLDADL